MEKIQINVVHGSGSLLEALGLPDTKEYKQDFAERCEKTVETFKKVLRGEVPSEGEGAYTRSHFAEDIIRNLSAAEIVFLALSSLEDAAVEQIKAEVAKEGLGKVLQKLEEEMRSRGIDVDTMKKDLDAKIATGMSKEEIMESMAVENYKADLNDLENCKAEEKE